MTPCGILTHASRTGASMATIPTGAHSLRWDGIDGRGRSVASGIYFLLLTAGSQHETVKLTVIK